MRPFTCLRSVWWFARWARGPTCCAALLALVALVVAGCDDNGRSSKPSASGAVGATLSPVAQQWLSDLLAPPDVSFEVVFRQYNWAGDASYFVWRQGSGRRRWDYVPITPEGLKAGVFSLETDFSAGASFSNSSIGCGWSTRPAGLGSGEAHVDCAPSGPDDPLLAPVTAALMSDVGEQLSEETIAGRRASCYSLQRPPALGQFDSAVVCLDSANGIPLRLEIEAGINYGLTVAMEAVSVSQEKQDLVVPVELQPDPRHPDFSGLRGFNGTVPIATLQLPDLGQFEQ
jgi:hypothetical protein